MRYLARVRDGSRKPITSGYWLCQRFLIRLRGDRTLVWGQRRLSAL